MSILRVLNPQGTFQVTCPIKLTLSLKLTLGKTLGGTEEVFLLPTSSPRSMANYPCSCFQPKVLKLFLLFFFF